MISKKFLFFYDKEHWTSLNTFHSELSRGPLGILSCIYRNLILYSFVSFMLSSLLLKTRLETNVTRLLGSFVDLYILFRVLICHAFYSLNYLISVQSIQLGSYSCIESSAFSTFNHSQDFPYIQDDFTLNLGGNVVLCFYKHQTITTDKNHEKLTIVTYYVSLVSFV